MGKERKSKRQLIRDEKRARQKTREQGQDTARETKRRRTDADNNEGALDYIPLEDDGHGNEERIHKRPRHEEEREFFGMLTDEEQEYFRHADEMLELNDFPSDEERNMFLQNVYREAVGKELKLASSQSCSRLMERLILRSTPRQKKHLFEAFATHFVSLVTHRFASHCCEKLFLHSAPIVTQELSGVVDDGPGPAEEAEEKAPSSMEELFLLSLDELGEHLNSLLSDRYASHTLRVLLVVLSGKPLEGASTKSLLQSKKKEHITVHGAYGQEDEAYTQTRAVPSNFTWAVRKIISDIASGMDPTSLRVLATHPTGNPVLQLLLELDISLTVKTKGKKQAKETADEEEGGEQGTSLLERLLPDAPASFSNPKSEASSFVSGMLYDAIGSRLLETLVSHAPGKVFKGLYANFFGPRISTLLRNDIASYPAIQALNRLSKEDLSDAVHKSLGEVPTFVEKGRFNVLKTLFERCHVRNDSQDVDALLKALVAASGKDWKFLVPKLCFLDEEPEDQGPQFQKDSKNKTALVSHGSQLVSALLGISGTPAKAIQASLLSLAPDQVLHLATSTPQTANILVKALSTPSQNPNFHKILVASMAPRIIELTETRHAQEVLNAIIAAPSKGDGIAVPFHTKESIMSRLAEHESALRETFIGRKIWRAWKGDIWNRKRYDWVRWAKGMDAEPARFAKVPQPRTEKQDQEKQASSRQTNFQSRK
ncbi:ARM repeat-containing protein [Thozetella sp. PMI_491]|nr:ARM repeat-containing protein [Thozetella sp. PMI_491]